MALADLLAAIRAAADQKISEARSEHQKMMTELKEANERELSKVKTQLNKQKEERKTSLRAKTVTHATQQKNALILKKKRALLDQTYAAVLEELKSLKPDKLETILRLCLKEVSTKGTVHPASAHKDLLKKLAPSEQFKIGDTIDSVGGFRVVSAKQEYDYTFEHLVISVLKPQTELETAHTLFPAN